MLYIFLIFDDANDCIIALIRIQLFFCCYCSAALNTGPDCGQFQQNTAELSCQEMPL